MIELLSPCKYKGLDAYVCARTWPSTAKPESMYDVIIIETKRVVANIPESELSDVGNPDPDAVARVRR